MGQHLGRDDLGVGRAPTEDDAEIVELVAEPPGEEEGPKAELRQELRQLCGMTEGVRRVPRPRRLDAELPADAPAEQQVADERLSADEQLVGEHIPGANLESSGREQRAQALLALGAELEIILQDDRLPVQREGAKRLVALEHLEDPVDHRSEAQAEDLERHVPLAVPVGVRYDEIRELRDLGHAGDTIAPPRGTKPEEGEHGRTGRRSRRRSSAPESTSPNCWAHALWAEPIRTLGDSNDVRVEARRGDGL